MPLKKKLFLIFLFFLTGAIYKLSSSDELMMVVDVNSNNIYYQSHVESIGWMDYRKSGETSGTVGESKRLEAFKISLEEKGIEYRSYVEGDGWQEYKKNDEVSGTTGLSKKIEAIQIRLSEELNEYYNVYYRVHVQNLGWLGWAKNDEVAGTSGYNYRIEAIQIKLLDKGDELISDNDSFYSPLIKYKTHIEDIGWTDYSFDGNGSGSENSGKRIEALQMEFPNMENDIEYRSYVEGEGWQEYKKNDEVSGTTGLSKKIEAIQVKLSEETIEKYNIYYRVYVQKMGWLGWAKNNEVAGTLGYNYRIEAIQIKLLDKDNELISDKNSFYSKEIKYKSHVEDIGWMNYKDNDEISGTTGISKRLEAFQIEFMNIKGIEYSSYVEGEGWQDYKKDGQVSGTTGLSKKIEAIRIKLYGEALEKYDIYYRVHVQFLGWLGWAKNDERAGTSGYDYKIEAVQIKLIDKKDSMETGNSYLNKKIDYSSHISNIGWQEYKKDGETSGVLGNKIEALKIRLLDGLYEGNIEYKCLINGFGWEEKYKNNEDISGTTGRSKPIEAVQIKLTGDVSNIYDVCYRVYVQNLGWLGWTQNGEMTGTNGYNYAIEAIEIKLLEKDEDHPFIQNDVYHISKDGYYNIGLDDRYLDVDSPIKSGRKVYLEKQNFLKNQIWKIKEYNDGTYRIFSSVNPKFVININNKLTLSRFEGSNFEKIKITDLGNGYYDIRGYDNSSLSSFFNTDSNFKLEKYEGIKIYKGIDISKWQGNINWEELVSEIPEFIIMRVGTGRNNYEKDFKFDEYYSKASSYDIPIGAYTYSNAVNFKDAEKEALLTLEWLDNKNLDLPVFYDIENINQALLGKDVLTKIAETFCDKITDSGYKCGIYASKYFLIDSLNASELSKYPIWLAHWTGANTYSEATLDKFKTDYNLTNYNYWQFSSLGVYRGITENTVDLDLGYDIFD